MKLEKQYTISELNRILEESTKNEFQPVLGKDVVKDDKKNNEKAVKDIEKETKPVEYSRPKAKSLPNAESYYGKTTLEVDFNEFAPGKDYVERVKAQVHGFPSVENEKNSDAKKCGNLDYGGNEEIYDDIKDGVEKRAKDKEENANSGLKTRELGKDRQKKVNTMFENKNMKRLHFKRTIFLNEEQLIRHIPEDYKVNEARFFVKDATGTEYLVECRCDSELGYKQVKVLNRMNKESVNEELDRMRSLFGYSMDDYGKSTVNENNVKSDIDKIRNLRKS